jgi:hypothetical protein
VTGLATRVRAAAGPVALVVALLALLASAAGVGYAAGQIGTADLKDNAVTAEKIKKNAVTGKKIKKNAVTSKKVKDGSITPADLAAQEPQITPALGNGGEGDCVWQGGQLEVPGSGSPAYRLDRDGRVILSGIALGVDGPGGDADCDPSDPGQIADGIIFTLPAGYMPAHTQYLATLGSFLVIAGPQGFTMGSLSLPPGAVFGEEGVILEGVEFDPVGSDVVVAKMRPSGRWSGPLL